MEGEVVERRTVDDLVAEASAAIVKLPPAEAWEAACGGARVIDIRSEAARARDGIVPGSFHIPRTVLEWRLDPASPWRNPHFRSLDDMLVVVCEHGFASTLAAYALVQLGYRHVADVCGGFDAWLRADLPVGRPSLPAVADALPGSGPCDELDQRAGWEQALRKSPDRYGREASAPARATQAMLATAGARDLLELGAGQGRDTLHFAAAGLRVTALDFASAAVETIEAKAAAAGLGRSITARRHDVREPLPVADDSFDACYSHMLFCMALDEAQLAALAGEIRRALRPGGLCVYTARTTGDPDAGRGRHLGESIYELDGFCVHFFDTELIERLAAGYELLEVVQFEEGSLPRRLVRVTMRTL